MKPGQPIKTQRKRRGPPRAQEVLSAEQAVANVLQQYNIAKVVRANRLAIEWEALVGSRIARHAGPQGIVRGVLIVKVESSAWMHQLTMMKASLLANLIAALGEPRLFSDMRFVLGARPAAPLGPTNVRPSQPMPAVAPTPAFEIVRDVDQVEDLELRTLIGAVRLRHLR